MNQENATRKMGANLGNGKGYKRSNTISERVEENYYDDDSLDSFNSNV